MADNAERTTASKLMMEGVGTATLLFTIGMTQPSNDIQRLSAAVTAILIVLIYMGVELSGAHYNPAVTLTVWLRRRCSSQVAALYVGTQLVGACVGVALANMCSAGDGQGSSALQVGEGTSILQALGVELIFTSLLCFSVLTLALRSHSPVSPLLGVAVASLIFAGLQSTIDISGAAFNPAVALSLSLASGGAHLWYALLLCAAHALSAVLATAAFYLVAPEEMDALKTDMCDVTSNLSSAGAGEHAALLSPPHSIDRAAHV